MAEVFVTNVEPYDVRDRTNLVLPTAGTNQYGIDTVRFVGQKLWQTAERNQRVSNIGDIEKKYKGRTS